MTIEFTYTSAREQLATLLDRVTKDREVVIIQRRGEEEVAMIAASELESLLETAYLLRSPANAERLISALGRALKGEGEPQGIASLRRELKLEPEGTAGSVPARIHRGLAILGGNRPQAGAESNRSDRGDFTGPLYRFWKARAAEIPGAGRLVTKTDPRAPDCISGTGRAD